MSIIAGKPTKVSSTSSVSLRVISVRAATSSKVSTLIVLLCLSIVLSYDSKGASVSQSSTKSSISSNISYNTSSTSSGAYDWLSCGLYRFVTSNTTSLVSTTVFWLGIYMRNTFVEMYPTR